jgi:hypothetical protein
MRRKNQKRKCVIAPRCANAPHSGHRANGVPNRIGETYTHQECVAEGHYEVHQERVRVADASPVGVINPMLAGLGVHVGK